MKNKLTILLLILFLSQLSAKSKAIRVTFDASTYEGSVTFPAGYMIGDYIEFLKVSPLSVGASGHYQISINYTRGFVAAAATHLASISHANPTLWRETGRINNNPYMGTGINFTIDCNTQSGNSRFRIRATNTLGDNTPITVNIKVTSLNSNSSFTTLNSTGNDTGVTKFLPMTSDWNLYVGDVFSANGASLAIKAIQNGNVGIGTSTPDSKLTVSGNVHAREVKVTLNAGSVPDYVFAKDYQLKSLEEVEDYIKQNSHLPEIPSAKEIEKNGLMLAEMNMSLLKKIEELTLYMIEMKKENEKQNEKILILENKLEQKNHE
jgi:hypothetical protein